MQLAIHDSLFQTCLDRIAPYRKEKPKGAIAEGYVGLVLDSCSGQLDREPDFSGKRPDYEWTVKPELPSSYRFIVEVVYIGNDERAVDLVKGKAHKYQPLAEHQYYVVAAVYEDGLDIEEIQRPCMPRLQLGIGINVKTGETWSTDDGPIPQEYTTGYASLLWLIPFPPELSEGSLSQTMTIAEILSSNAKHLHADILTMNLARSSPWISRVEKGSL